MEPIGEISHLGFRLAAETLFLVDDDQRQIVEDDA